MKKISELFGLTCEQIYERAMLLYRENKKGDLELAKQFGIELPKWKSQYKELHNMGKKKESILFSTKC